MPVPGREVEAECEAFGAGGVGKFADDIAPALPPGTRGDRVGGERRRPETEAVVVLGGEDDGAEPAGPCGADPLPGVERRGREYAGILVAVPIRGR